MKVTIGIDLGDHKSHACALDAAGDVFWRGTFASKREGIATFLGGFMNARLMMEVGQHSRWVSALAQELGHEVIVANPAHVRLYRRGNTSLFASRDAERTRPAQAQRVAGERCAC